MRKRSLEILDKALKIPGVKAKRTVLVGDTLAIDIKGAKDSGLKAIQRTRALLISYRITFSMRLTTLRFRCDFLLDLKDECGRMTK